MQKKTYTVHRTMQDGAKEYLPGSTREMIEADAGELVAIGALSLEGEEPVERPASVVHTFGERPSEYTTYTSASGEAVGADVLAGKSVTIERKSARTKDQAQA